MESIQKTTIKVPKNTLEEIRGYCIKKGKQVGDWAETAWQFIKKYDFDIYDEEATPFIPVANETQAGNPEIKALCGLMAEFISTAQQQSQKPLIEALEADKSALAAIDRKDQEIANLRQQLLELEKWKATASAELRRCKGLFAKADSKAMKDLGLD